MSRVSFLRKFSKPRPSRSDLFPTCGAPKTQRPQENNKHEQILRMDKTWLVPQFAQIDRSIPHQEEQDYCSTAWVPAMFFRGNMTPTKQVTATKMRQTGGDVS